MPKFPTTPLSATANLPSPRLSSASPTRPVSAPSNLVDIASIAQTLGVSKRQVQKMMRGRAIPFVTLGRRCIRFDPVEVLSFIKRKYGIQAADYERP
jgi:predicted DNA-binding transcriptional regulator AlpA